MVEQAIRYPTDLSLLNEASEFSELIIDTLCANLSVDQKPRTYRKKARKAYLAIAKQKRPGAKTLRRGAHRAAMGNRSGRHAPTDARLVAPSLLGDSTSVSTAMGHVSNPNTPL